MNQDAENRMNDDTLNRRIIDMLREDEAWFRMMIDRAPVGISIARDGITLYANEACLRMFGYDGPKDFVCTSRLNRVAPECRWLMNLYINKRKKGEEIPRQFEFTGLRKDGSTF